MADAARMHADLGADIIDINMGCPAKKELKKALGAELSSKATKDEIAEITKKVMKKLYKDLSFHHPYIIDRIKV